MNKIIVTLSIVMLLFCSAKCHKPMVVNKENTTTNSSSSNGLQPIENQDLQTMQSMNSKLKQEVSDSKETQEKGYVAEYLANTRGYYLKLVFANGKIEYTNERDSQNLSAITLNSKQIVELNGLIASVDLEALPTLKSPTEKRFYDGAAMANLNITANGKTYNSDTFDHGYPPAAIEKLVQKLVSYLPK